MRQLIIISILLFFVNPISGQDFQTKYLAAKTNFENGQYAEAMSGFKPLILESPYHPFERYASFYFGLSAFKNGTPQPARDIWKQIIEIYPDWENINEVKYWLSLSYLKEGNFEQALGYSSSIPEQYKSDLQRLKIKYLENLEIEKLETLNNKFPSDRSVALVYARKLYDNNKAIDRVNSLIKAYDLDVRDVGLLDFRNIKKDSYNIAVMLPFLFNGLNNTSSIIRNNFINQLYFGMAMALNDLNDEGIEVNVYPFDTERSGQSTASLIETENFSSADLIVGPLYPDPFDRVTDYAVEEKVNVINPISLNPKILDSGPFSFLFMPSYETLAKRLADYADDNLENRTLIVLTTDEEKDLRLARAYLKYIKDTDLDLIAFKKVEPLEDGEENFEVIDFLAHREEVVLTKAEADSLREIPGKIVRTRKKLYEEIDGEKVEIQYAEGTKIPEEVYELRLEMKEDSIGHIFVASDNPSLVADVISAVEIRGDSTQIFGLDDWLNFQNVNYLQLERLGVKLLAPRFYDDETEAFNQFENRFIKKYQMAPTIQAVIGYELIYLMGNLLNEYGKYFQLELRADYIPGKFFWGYDFSNARDNQIVPIVEFKDGELIKIN